MVVGLGKVVVGWVDFCDEYGFGQVVGRGCPMVLLRTVHSMRIDRILSRAPDCEGGCVGVKRVTLSGHLTGIREQIEDTRS